MYDVNTESDYCNVVKSIIESGMDRNNTRSLFGLTMRWSLLDGEIPLLTTRRMFKKGIVEELLWFIRGQTNIEELNKVGVHIWDDNASAFGSNDLGPIYGFQWRKFGNQVDQLKKCIDMIKNNPSSRRIIMTAWNPLDIDKMALPPCHFAVQFLVHDDKVTTVLTQRSGDMILGVPFNIASYGILTHIICKLTNTIPYQLIHNIADAHIYKEHVEGALIQITRMPFDFPKIKIGDIKSIDDIKSEDIVFPAMKSHPAISFKMIVT